MRISAQYSSKYSLTAESAEDRLKTLALLYVLPSAILASPRAFTDPTLRLFSLPENRGSQSGDGSTDLGSYKESKKKKDSRSISGNLYFTYAERLYQHMRIGSAACNRLLALKIVYCDLSRRKHRTIYLEEIEASRLERVVERLSVVSGRL